MSSGLLVAYFEDENGLLRAAREARAAGLKIHDAYTPYAVHGLDAAMGQRGSRLPWVTLLCGLTGMLLAFWFQRWTSAVSWPINVGGKPAHSFPAFIPVAFEFTVLLAALGTVAALFIRVGLRPRFGMPRVLPRVTNDRFALALCTDGEDFSSAAATELCRQAGACEVSAAPEAP